MLPAVDSRTFRIRGGNARLPERLLEASGAKVKSDWVVDTVRPAKHGRFELHASRHIPSPGGESHHHHHRHQHKHRHKHGHHHGHHHGHKRGLAENGEQDAAERGTLVGERVGEKERDGVSGPDGNVELLSWEQVRTTVSMQLTGMPLVNPSQLIATRYHAVSQPSAR